MRKEIPLATAALLALTAPAGAACLDQIAELEPRLARLESEAAGGAQQQQQATTAGVQQQQPERQQPQQQPAADEAVEVTMQDGQEVEVTAEPSGGEGQPQDTWLGGTSPSSVQGAREQLDGARTAAEEGNEEGCLEQLEQAERIVNGLEQQ